MRSSSDCGDAMLCSAVLGCFDHKLAGERMYVLLRAVLCDINEAKSELDMCSVCVRREWWCCGVSKGCDRRGLLSRRRHEQTDVSECTRLLHPRGSTNNQLTSA